MSLETRHVFKPWHHSEDVARPFWLGNSFCMLWGLTYFPLNPRSLFSTSWDEGWEILETQAFAKLQFKPGLKNNLVLQARGYLTLNTSCDFQSLASQKCQQTLKLVGAALLPRVTLIRVSEHSTSCASLRLAVFGVSCTAGQCTVTPSHPLLSQVIAAGSEPTSDTSQIPAPASVQRAKGNSFWLLLLSFEGHPHCCLLSFHWHMVVC